MYECLNDDGRIWAAKIVPLRPGEDDRSRAAQAEIEKEIEVSVPCSVHARHITGVHTGAILVVLS